MSMASHEITESEHAVSAGAVLFAMLVVLVIGVSAVVVFGYAALIVLALAGTAAMLVTLVVLTAGG